MTAELEIKSKSGSTPVMAGPGLLGKAGAVIAGRFASRHAAVVTDENVAALYLERLASGLNNEGIKVHTIAVTPGEAAKSFAGLELVCRGLLQSGLDRDDLVIALGGGVVGDLAGLAAALVKRGLTLIHAPTTLTAQADSSLGGKTAINTPEGKNLIGAIYPPHLVLSDISALGTLPAGELGAGYSEVIKHAILDGEEHFAFLENSIDDFFAGDEEARLGTIIKSIRFKGGIIERDQRDEGERQKLNLGHTFAHAIEAASGLAHGQAVAIGLVLAFEFAGFEGADIKKQLGRTKALLKRAGLPATCKQAGAACAAKDLLPFIARDKKSRGGNIRLIVPKDFGAIYIREMRDTGELERFFNAVGLLS